MVAFNRVCCRMSAQLSFSLLCTVGEEYGFYYTPKSEGCVWIFICLELLLFLFFIMTAYTVRPFTFYISREKQKPAACALLMRLFRGLCVSDGSPAQGFSCFTSQACCTNSLLSPCILFVCQTHTHTHTHTHIPSYQLDILLNLCAHILCSCSLCEENL